MPEDFADSKQNPSVDGETQEVGTARRRAFFGFAAERLAMQIVEPPAGWTYTDETRSFSTIPFARLPQT
jgi:hypothetical protein